MLLTAGMVGVACQAEDAPAASSGAPKITFDKTTYDWGSTSMVTKLEGTIVISNTGDAPLENLQAKPSCGCTSAPLKTNKLAPGEKTELQFSLNVGAMNRGHMSKQITITCNDPKQPSTVLTLKADIVSLYDITPTVLNAGDIRIGTETNLTLLVKRTDGKPHGITKADGTTAALKATFEPASGSVDSGTVRVTVTAEGAPRRFNDSVRIFGENTNQPVAVITVMGRVVGDLTLSQDTMFWGIANAEDWPGERGETATTRRIIITCSTTDTKPEFSNLRCETMPDLKVALKPVAEGKTYELSAVLEKAPKENAVGTIKFDTNLKSQPTVEVRYTINVMKQQK